MITLGVDLAAEPARTAAVLLDCDRRLVVDARVGVDDDTIVDLADGVAKIGIDCPLGWPDDFVDFVVAHRGGPVAAPAATIAERRPLAYRASDEYCRDREGLRPLSVSADRIAHAAFRGAALLARLGETDRSGRGRVVEAYPAGSLKRWTLPHQGYKSDRAAIATMLALIETRAGLTFARGMREICLATDHAFDALVVALTARAAATGRTDPIPEDLVSRARREGWISLPDPALEALLRE